MNRRTLLRFLSFLPAFVFGRKARAERVEKAVDEDRPKLAVINVWVPNADPDQVIWRLKGAIYQYSWEPVALEDYVDQSPDFHSMQFDFFKADGKCWGSRFYISTQTMFDNMDAVDVHIRNILGLAIKYGAKSSELNDIKISFFHL